MIANEPTPEAKTLRVAAVQFQHAPGDKSANMAMIRRFVEQAAAQNVELICFPECCISGYWHLRHLTREQMANWPSRFSTGRHHAFSWICRSGTA